MPPLVLLAASLVPAAAEVPLHDVVPACIAEPNADDTIAKVLARMRARTAGRPECAVLETLRAAGMCAENDATCVTLSSEPVIVCHGIPDHSREWQALVALGPALRRCHTRALRSRPDLAGTWTVALTFPTATGDLGGYGVPTEVRWARPWNVTAGDSWSPPPEPLASCILDAARTARVPETRAREIVRVPLTFRAPRDVPGATP